MADPVSPPSGLVNASGQELQSKVSLDSLTRLLEGEKERVKLLQQQAKLMKEGGYSIEEINTALRKLNLAPDQITKVMGALEKSMTDIMKMKPHELFQNFGTVMTSMSKMALPLLSLEALIDIFKMLDSAAARANKTLATMAIQSGTLGNISGIGGVGGRAGVADDNERKRMTDQYYKSAMAIVAMGYSADQAAAVMSDLATKLPIQFTAAAPEFAKTIAALSRTMEMDLGTTTELLTTMFRRGITTAGGLEHAFNGLKEISKSTGMPLDMVAKQFSELWSATRQFGGTTTEVQRTMMDFGSALDHTLLSVQEVAQGFNGMKELSIPKIVALFESLGGSKTRTERESLFGNAKTPQEAIENYLEKASGKGLDLANFQRAQFAGLKAVASTIEGVSPRTAFEIARSQYPMGYEGGGEGNRQLSQRIATGVGVNTPAGPFTLEDSGERVKNAFAGVSGAAIHLAAVTAGLADSFARMKEELKLAGGAVSQGRFGVADAAVRASGLLQTAPNLNPFTAAINFTVHILTPTDADDVGRQTAHHLKNILADTKRKGS